MSDPAFVTNYQMSPNGPFITDRTHHKVRDADGRSVTAQCGASFTVESHQFTDDEGDLQDRHKCQRPQCFGTTDA